LQALRPHAKVDHALDLVVRLRAKVSACELQREALLRRSRAWCARPARAPGAAADTNLATACCSRSPRRLPTARTTCGPRSRRGPRRAARSSRPWSRAYAPCPTLHPALSSGARWPRAPGRGRAAPLARCDAKSTRSASGRAVLDAVCGLGQHARFECMKRSLRSRSADLCRTAKRCSFAPAALHRVATLLQPAPPQSATLFGAVRVFDRAAAGRPRHPGRGRRVRAPCRIE
jgi:hypothetical protein